MPICKLLRSRVLGSQKFVGQLLRSWPLTSEKFGAGQLKAEYEVISMESGASQRSPKLQKKRAELRRRFFHLLLLETARIIFEDRFI